MCVKCDPAFSCQFEQAPISLLEIGLPCFFFKKRLQDIRHDRGLTQTEVAGRCGLKPSAIAHFESGRRKPSFDNIIILAQALNVTIDYLLGVGRGTTKFHDEDKLTESDREFIQGIIDMRIKGESNVRKR